MFDDLCLPHRNHKPEEEISPHLMVEDKRRRNDVLSLEEELLRYKLLVSEGRKQDKGRRKYVDPQQSLQLKEKMQFLFLLQQHCMCQK